MDLAGKNVVYLGGFGGIGQRVCVELLGRQIKALAIFDLTLNEQVLQTWQAKYPKVEIFYQKVDITKKPEIEAAYKATAARLKHFDLVVNGMGLLNDRLIDLTIEINLLGLIHSSLIALDYMDKAKGGKGGVVMNISSVAGIQPASCLAVYSASKHGVTAFTRSLGDDAYFEHTGVAFVTICPGLTDTVLLSNLLDKTTFEYETPLTKAIQKAKVQSPQDCAANIVKIAEQAKTGSVWLLDLAELKELDMPVMWKAELNDA